MEPFLDQVKFCLWSLEAMRNTQGILMDTLASSKFTQRFALTESKIQKKLISMQTHLRSKDLTRFSIIINWNGLLVYDNLTLTVFIANSYVFLLITAHIKFSVDDKVIGLVETNDGHFYRTANTVNIWEEGNLDAPFDQEVCIYWTRTALAKMR